VRQQPRLPDPGGAFHQEHRAGASDRRVDRGGDRGYFRRPLEQRAGGRFLGTHHAS
jgi:hypothetical protein